MCPKDINWVLFSIFFSVATKLITIYKYFFYLESELIQCLVSVPDFGDLLVDVVQVQLGLGVPVDVGGGLGTASDAGHLQQGRKGRKEKGGLRNVVRRTTRKTNNQSWYCYIICVFYELYRRNERSSYST